MSNNWNNPIQRKTMSIFENLRRSRETEKVSLPVNEGVKVSETKSLVPGAVYSFGGTDFLAVVENGVIREPEIEAFSEGTFNDHTWITTENKLTFVRQDENTLVFNLKEGEETIEVCIANNESRNALVDRLVAEANGREIMPEPKKATEPNVDSNFPSGFIGDFEHGINDKGHGGFAGDGIGDYEKDPLTSKGEKGGQDASSDELLGNKGTPEKFGSDTKSKKDKEAELGDDALTGSKEAGKYEKGDKQMGSHGSAKDFAREGVEMDKEDDEEEDKKDKEDEKDEDKKDKKDVKEAKEMDDEKEDKKKKDDEDDEKDEDKKDKKDMKDMDEGKTPCEDCGKSPCVCQDIAESVEKGDPKKDKEAKKEMEDEDEKKAKDEKEEVDEATARFFQEVGASVVRALIGEMAKGGQKGLLTNESFIIEVAKRVARIEREGIKAVLPKTLESKMVYPAVPESMNFIDLVVFETNEGFYAVDRLNSDKVYRVETDAVDLVIKEGITSHAKSLSKVDEKVIFKGENQEYKFF